MTNGRAPKNKKTNTSITAKAAKVLKDPKASKAEKTGAASALTQKAGKAPAKKAALVGTVQSGPVALPRPASEIDALCALVERLATDPSVDVAKLRDMMEMRKDLRAEAARMSYEDAFIDMQPHLPSIDKTGRIIIDETDETNEKTGEKIVVSQYAKWENINDVITPILHQHGFSLRFDFERDQAHLTTLAILTHRGGHQTTTRSPPLPIDNTGGKNNTQGWGSTSSYGKRYAATAALNIRSHDIADNDGATPDTAGLPKTISPEHAADLSDRLLAAEANIPKFCKYFGVARISDLSPKDYERAIGMVKIKEGGR